MLRFFAPANLPTAGETGKREKRSDGKEKERATNKNLSDMMMLQNNHLLCKY